MREDEFNILKEKSSLVSSDIYQKLRKYQIDQIIQLSSTNLDSVEIKGMLKLINKTDSWYSDFVKITKKE